ncbi:TatD family hydrolase [Gracilimonas mengyeensis]|uniref:TatD DNase family protein n=1 Tax=Gracilimonas mengyeensis TaxID=1302730 RepID=A0A521EAP3_9BACT|nr:TatD family hydrolase [Gracilimonas mengyeensis]SMO80531.1 TatD DNase family protein [Gracilimonas mengyeensis]
MIDTHSHIYLSKFDEDRDEVNARAVEAGVKAIMMPAIDFDSISQMEKLSHPELQFYKMAGIHPCDVPEVLPEELEQKLLDFCGQDDFYGVGETGLDYYWSTERVEQQKQSFRLHCEVAKEVQKPVIIHNRESTEDVLDIVEEEQDGSLKGIWHCFNGSVDEGKRAIDLGLYLGIGGVATFKNAGVDKTVAQLPLDKMMLETDAPYLSPTPKRGKRNEPAFMKFTAQKLAELFDLSLEEIDQRTTKIASQLFGLEL